MLSCAGVLRVERATGFLAVLVPTLLLHIGVSRVGDGVPSTPHEGEEGHHYCCSHSTTYACVEAVKLPIQPHSFWTYCLNSRWSRITSSPTSHSIISMAVSNSSV